MAGKGRPGPECGIARLLREADPELHEALTELLADDSVSHAAIVRALAAADNPIGYSIIRWHRQGYCRCREAGQ